LQLLTENEASGRLKCTVAALRRWRRERRGPRYVKMGRLVRYSQKDLEDFIERSTQNVIQEKRKLTAFSH
jgi:predicted DNA-binding transcriptional regulator AlpA